MSETVLLQMFLGRITLLSAVTIPPATSGLPDAGADRDHVRFVEDTLLSSIGSQLELPICASSAPATCRRRSRLRHRRCPDEPIVRFAWTPKRPGAEILHSVVPFLGIALAGFALLAGLVLRFMRRTADTITAGENRLRYLALHDPLCGPAQPQLLQRTPRTAVIAEVQQRRRAVPPCSTSTSTTSRTSTTRSAIRSATN